MLRHAAAIVILLHSPPAAALVLDELVIIRERDRLVGRIHVRDLEGIRQEGMRARVAPPSLYRQLGLPYADFLNQLKMDYRSIDRERGVVTLSLPYGIARPFVLLMEIRWPQGRLVRSYAVRIPNGLFAPRDKVILRISPAEVSAPRQTRPPSASEPDRIAAAMHYVRIDTVEGDDWRNLAEAIRQVYLKDEKINVEQIMLALRDANMEDFSGYRSSILHIDASLRLPDYYEIAAYDPQEARRIIDAILKKHTAGPLLVLSAPPTWPEGDFAALGRRNTTHGEKEAIGGRLALVDVQSEPVERLIALEREKLTIIQTLAMTREGLQPAALGENGTVTRENFDSLEFAIRRRIDEFFIELRTQPFFWTLIALLVLILSCLYLFIFARRRGPRTATGRPSSARTPMEDPDRQAHLFPVDSPAAAAVTSSEQPEQTSEQPEPKGKRIDAPRLRKAGPVPQEGRVPLQDDVRKANLDLARAYINMNENKKAKKLLEETMQHGSAKEKKEAKRLLGRMPQQ